MFDYCLVNPIKNREEFVWKRSAPSLWNESKFASSVSNATQTMEWMKSNPLTEEGLGTNTKINFKPMRPLLRTSTQMRFRKYWLRKSKDLIRTSLVLMRISTEMKTKTKIKNFQDQPENLPLFFHLNGTTAFLKYKKLPI